MRTMPSLRAALAATLIGSAAGAFAHDSWLEAPSGSPGLLRLGTGNQYPMQESAIGAEYLRQQGCTRRDGSPAALSALGNDDSALILEPAAGAASCWAQLAPFEIELAADKIAVYLNEIRPPRATQEAWAAMHARGLPWKERYTKHARIELPGRSGAALPSGLGLDVLLDGPADPKVGDGLAFQVLRDGAPLPDFAVELRSERTRFGIWRRTDAEGRLRFQPPLAGAWLLRGIDLRLSETAPDTWDSRFVTLAFQVAPKTAAP